MNDFMNNKWVAWLFGALFGMALMGLLVSCDEARTQDNPTPVSKEEPAKPKEPDNQINDLFTKLDALRTGQLMTLINQLCTEENGTINEECGDSISRCFAEKWSPVNKLLQCYREWKDSEKQEVKP